MVPGWIGHCAVTVCNVVERKLRDGEVRILWLMCIACWYECYNVIESRRGHIAAGQTMQEAPGPRDGTRAR